MARKLCPRAVDPVRRVQYDISMPMSTENLPTASSVKRCQRTLSARSLTTRQPQNTDHCIVIPLDTSAICHFFEQFLAQRNKFRNREVPCQSRFDDMRVACPGLPVRQNDVCLADKPPEQHSICVALCEPDFLCVVYNRTWRFFLGPEADVVREVFRNLNILSMIIKFGVSSTLLDGPEREQSSAQGHTLERRPRPFHSQKVRIGVLCGRPPLLQRHSSTKAGGWELWVSDEAQQGE